MSRTIKGSKGAGYKYWSNRPGNFYGGRPGKRTKTITHRKERRRADRQLQKLSV